MVERRGTADPQAVIQRRWKDRNKVLVPLTGHRTNQPSRPSAPAPRVATGGSKAKLELPKSWCHRARFRQWRDGAVTVVSEEEFISPVPRQRNLHGLARSPAHPRGGQE